MRISWLLLSLSLCMGLLCLEVLCSGCASTSVPFAQHADALGLESGWVSGNGFRLATFRSRVSQPREVLHLYLDGDGRPWRTRTRVARNPTPRNPLVLNLLARDPAPAMYLGRPCYHDEHEAPGCDAWLWTAGRYSETVISAMAAALAQVIETAAIERVVLIGYSGGGVIAWHLAQRVPQVEGLVTVAANLDLRTWTRRHGYTPLDGSLNPAEGPPMRTAVRQLHLIGQHDENVPAALTQPLQQRFGPAFRRRIIAAGHTDGWLARWPGVLTGLD